MNNVIETGNCHSPANQNIKTTAAIGNKHTIHQPIQPESCTPFLFTICISHLVLINLTFKIILTRLDLNLFFFLSSCKLKDNNLKGNKNKKQEFVLLQRILIRLVPFIFQRFFFNCFLLVFLHRIFVIPTDYYFGVRIRENYRGCLN